MIKEILYEAITVIPQIYRSDNHFKQEHGYEFITSADRLCYVELFNTAQQGCRAHIINFDRHFNEFDAC